MAQEGQRRGAQAADRHGVAQVARLLAHGREVAEDDGEGRDQDARHVPARQGGDELVDTGGLDNDRPGNAGGEHLANDLEERDHEQLGRGRKVPLPEHLRARDEDVGDRGHQRRPQPSAGRREEDGRGHQDVGVAGTHGDRQREVDEHEDDQLGARVEAQAPPPLTVLTH